MHFKSLLGAVCVASLLATSIALDAKCLLSFIEGVGEDLSGEIKNILEPVEHGLVDYASDECSKLKKIFGVAYSEYDSTDEPDLEQLTLELRTQNSTTTYNISSAADQIPASMSITSRHKLVIFVHGFTDDPTTSSFGNISDAFIAQGEHHILALDASPLIRWLYLRSTTYVRFIGEKLGAVLAAIHKHGVEPSNMHIIGHSLGAHIAGFAGKSYQNATGRNLGRISGLDPAGPCFSNVDSDHRLKSTDADYVDVMHTDAGVYGLRSPVGHADYYVNGGSDQPGCDLQTCSHSRAWLYYSESVLDPDSFPAVKCNSWSTFKAGGCVKETRSTSVWQTINEAKDKWLSYWKAGNRCPLRFFTTLTQHDSDSYMGYGSQRDSRGTYFLQTAEEEPFGRGKEGLHYKDLGSTKPVLWRVLSVLKVLAQHWDKC